MPETILTFFLLVVLCHGNFDTILSLLGSLWGGTSAATLRIGSAALTLLLFALLFVVFRFLLGRALSAVRQLSLSEVWRSFRQGICLRTVLHLLFGVAGSAAVGTLLLMAVYLLPTAPIQQHLSEYIPYRSSDTDPEAAYPSLSPLCTSRLDGSTDSIILLQSADDTPDTLLHKALLVYCGSTSAAPSMEDAVTTLYAHYHDGVALTGSWTYPRYWHGYLLLTKPLLCLFSFRQVQLLNAAVQCMLVLVVCWLLQRRALGVYIPAFLLVWLMLMPPALALCMQFTPCWLIALVCTIVLLKMRPAHLASRGWLVFLYSGIAVAYFDFLTYPLMAFGIPAAFYVLLTRQERTERTLGHLIQSGIAWGWGYAAMWVSKWVLATLFTGENVLHDAFSQAALRSSSSAAVGVMNEFSYSPIFTFFTNLGVFLFTPVTLLTLAFVLYTACKARRAGTLLWAPLQGPLLLYGAIGLLPLLWYTALRNHSLVHSWFTNKASSVLVLCIVFSCAAILEQVRQQPSSVPKR